MKNTNLAPAKINLYLHVTGKRSDGYHLLDTLVAFADIGDKVTIKPSDNLSLKISGKFARELSNADDNLIIKAAKLLQEEYSIKEGAEIHLRKNLPIAAGIGGGSTDGATALKLLNTLWDINLSNTELNQLALPLGADMPMCIEQKTALIGGIGEEFTPIDNLPELYAVMVNPNIPVSSAEIYQMRIKSYSGKANIDFSGQDIIGKIKHLNNDLQENALQLAPVINDVLEAIRGTENIRLARMSGSGATCFGLFERKSDSIKAQKSIKSNYPNWWIVSTILNKKIPA